MLFQRPIIGIGRCYSNFFLEKFLFQLEIDLVMCILTERSLCVKCPNTELFLVGIFLYLSVFRPNTGKYEPKITPYLDTFHTVVVLNCYPLISFRTLILNSRLCPTSRGLTISWKILPAFFWWPKNYGF